MTPVAGWATDLVTWMTYDFPPLYIVSGSEAGSGEFDQKLRYFTERMPAFEHRVELGSFNRAWYTLAHQDGLCILGAFTSPERAKIALFSKAAFSSLNLGVVVRKDQLSLYQPFLDANGDIDLEAFAKTSTMRGAYTSGRVYDAIVDQYIRAKKDGPSLVVAQNITNGFNMISAMHADYTFAFPHEIEYYQAGRGESGAMVLLSIAKLPKVRFSYIACSNGPVGQKIIAAANDLIDQAGTPPSYVPLGVKWLRPAQLALLSDQAAWNHIREQEVRSVEAKR